MTDRKNYDDQLWAIMNRAGDSVLELPEEELLAEEREVGIDPVKEAERIRDVLRRVSKMHRLRKLEAAEHAYHEQRTARCCVCCQAGHAVIDGDRSA